MQHRWFFETLASENKTMQLLKALTTRFHRFYPLQCYVIIVIVTVFLSSYLWDFIWQQLIELLVRGISDTTPASSIVIVPRLQETMMLMKEWFGPKNPMILEDKGIESKQRNKMQTQFITNTALNTSTWQSQIPETSIRSSFLLKRCHNFTILIFTWMI